MMNRIGYKVRVIIALLGLLIFALFISSCSRNSGLLDEEPVGNFPMWSDEGIGIMNCSGKWLLDPGDHKFGIIRNSMVDGLAPFSAAISQSDTYINLQGEIPFKEEYEITMPFSEGLAAVKVAGKWGFIDTKGSFVIQPQFLSYQIGSFQNGLVNVAIEVSKSFSDVPIRWIFIDRKGEKVLGPYRIAASFSDGYAAVTDVEGGKSGFINIKGEFVIEFAFDDRFEPAGNYSDGLFPVKDIDKQIKENKCSIGFMDKDKNWVIEPEYCEVGIFKNDLAPVTRTNDPSGLRKYGYINSSGEMVIGENYDSASSFSGGCALVIWDNYGIFGLIDPEGKIIYQYESAK